MKTATSTPPSTGGHASSDLVLLDARCRELEGTHDALRKTFDDPEPAHPTAGAVAPSTSLYTRPLGTWRYGEEMTPHPVRLGPVRRVLACSVTTLVGHWAITAYPVSVLPVVEPRCIPQGRSLVRSGSGGGCS